MTEAVFGEAAVNVLATEYTRHYYPVLGVVNGPTSDKSPLTAYGRQVARSIMRYFRGEAAGPSGWDSGGAGRVPRWQTESFERVDDIPRRKGVQQKQADNSSLSPRSRQGELWGEGLLSPRWVGKQQRRPAAVMSLHTLEEGNDVALGDEMARNRVCVAAYGLSYAAVVIVSRAQADEPQAEARLGALQQRSGLELTQFFVCRPSAQAPQQQAFHAFLGDFERRLYARACAFYAAAFMRTQAKLVALPQLPLPPSPASPGALGDDPRVFRDPGLVSRFSRFLPLRAWLVRYHFKLAVFAECGGDRDTAQRCMWLAYAHLLAYVGEIAAGAYLPAGSDDDDDDGPDRGLAPGWLWALNGGDADGSRARSLRMFGPRWDEAMQLLDAVHVRVVRGWLYQALDAAALRSSANTQQQQQLRPPPITPVSRSGPRAAATPTASPLSASFSEPMTSSAGGNGSLEALIFSVHAGECSAATEQLMEAERIRRQLGASDAMYFLALGSETADVDLLQPVASDTCGWWPLGGHYAVVDFSASSSGSRLRPTGFDGASRLGLVLNSSLDVGAAASLLPQTNHYDAHLTLAARQCVQHVVALALVLGRAGFGDASSSYFWAAVARQYSAHAALFVTAAANGVDFSGAFDAAASVDVSPQLQPSVVVDSVVATLRRPLGSTRKAAATAATPPVVGSRPVVRGRALSTAFTGFAFDEALGGIYAVVEPKERQRASESAGGGGGTLCPLWMWPRTAAPLFQAASFATLQRHRRLAAEETAYSTHSADARVFSANPGVENTYAGVWLAAERKRHADEPGATLAATTRLLSAAALACLHQHPPGATDGELLSVDALVGAISGDSLSAQFLCLASELAEVHAESGSFATALPIFQALVRRFRSEGWEALGRHALQWVGRCAAAVGDRRAALTAAVELLSQADGVSDIDALLGDAEPMVLDMTQMYAPIRCHAHWRHWRLKGPQMAFQVELDCRALARPLRLSELCVEFSDPRYCVRLGDDGTSEADGPLRFCDVRGERQKQCRLELKAGSTVVFEGSVEIDGGDVVASRALVLTGVSATIGNVTLRWPTCAPASFSSSQTAVVAHDGEQGFSPMEALLAARAAVARARDPLLLIGYAGAAGAAAADDAHVAAASYSEHAALRRAVAVAGPTVPANDRWLVGADAGSGHLRWEQLASPPLVPAQLLADEPGFSAYSRCRVLALPVAAEAGGLVVVTMPHVGDSAPAYRGEAFAVEIVVRNAHARLPAVGVAVDVRLASGLGDDVADSMTNLNVASSDASESGGGGAEPAVEAASNAPWLTAAEDGDDGNGSRARELLGVLAGGSAADLAPGESRTVTVFVNFPAAQLSSASQSTATDLAVVRCTVRYSTASSESPIHVIAQASIPVARPLYATAELLPAHVAAPDALPTPASATGGEFCFRRPVLVTLHNAGPWDVTVDRMALHPPSAEALSQALSAAGAAPMRMAVAGATAPSATLSAGGSLQHVFWVDITTRDLVRLAGDVCPGVLHVDWRRAASGSACVARLWLPAMRLVARRLTVESLCEAPVARVGQALGLGYRLTNLTRRARTLDVAMHATEAFVFAGPRRATITVLPGCATVLRFCLLSLTAATSATSATNPVSTAFAPGFAVFQDKGNATGLGWVRLPRLEIKDRENPAMSPSSAASLVVAAAPPPTRAAPSVLAASPEASVLAAAQRTVAALAVVGDVDRPLTPGLAAQCIDVLPPALVYGASGGVESDFEDEDEEKDDDERPADVDDDDDEILRLDQTAIYCLPAKD